MGRRRGRTAGVSAPAARLVLWQPVEAVVIRFLSGGHDEVIDYRW